LTYGWFDLAGLLEAVFMAVAYPLLQLNKLADASPSYSLLNAIGTFLVMIAPVFDFNFVGVFDRSLLVPHRSKQGSEQTSPALLLLSSHCT
jgi:hypothetical protein